MCDRSEIHHCEKWDRSAPKKYLGDVDEGLALCPILLGPKALTTHG